MVCNTLVFILIVTYHGSIGVKLVFIQKKVNGLKSLKTVYYKQNHEQGNYNLKRSNRFTAYLSATHLQTLLLMSSLVVFRTDKISSWEYKLSKRVMSLEKVFSFVANKALGIIRSLSLLGFNLVISTSQKRCFGKIAVIFCLLFMT